MKRLALLALAVVGIFSAAIITQAEPEDGPSAGPPRRERRERPEPPGPRPPIPLLERTLDADDDGEISAAEIAGASKALKKLDKNDDGKLSPDEFRPRRPRRGPAGERPFERDSLGQGRRPPVSDDDRPPPPRSCGAEESADRP